MGVAITYLNYVLAQLRPLCGADQYKEEYTFKKETDNYIETMETRRPHSVSDDQMELLVPL